MLAVRFGGAGIGETGAFLIDGGLVAIDEPVAFGRGLTEVGVFDHAAGGMV
tara:strand:+ start:1080 stop:1232 length:153 start_codon:yes stop_codon:yes gene_type:complete